MRSREGREVPGLLPERHRHRPRARRRVDGPRRDRAILREGPHPHYKTVQRRLHQITGITLDVLFWDSGNDRTKKLKGIDAIPRKKYPAPKWQIVYAVCHVSVKRLLQFNRSRHAEPLSSCLVMSRPAAPQSFSVADLSFDGVKLTKSCGRSFEVVSCQFEGCRQTFPLSIGIAEKGFSHLLTSKHVMSQPIRHLTENGVRIRNIIPDHPKRCGECGSPFAIGLANLQAKSMKLEEKFC